MALGISSAAVYDDLWDAGVDVARTYTIATDGVADNITGYSAAMTIYSERGGTLLSTLTGSVTGASGIVTFALPDTTSATWSQGTVVYDLQLTDGSGLIERLLTGTVTLRHSASKAV